MKPSILTIEALHSVLSPSELLEKVVPHYAVPTPAVCKFWHRGVNDTYRLSANGENYVLRIYRQGWRTISAIKFELSALLYLYHQGATVAIPIKKRDGGFVTSVLAPEGERYIIVTRYAEGSILKFENPSDATLFGQSVAEIHRCSSGFQPAFTRDKLDLRYLVEQPLVNIQPYLAHRPKDLDFLTGFAARLSSMVRAAADRLDYGFCHGDFHGENAHYHGQKVTHFDFDCCGFGWRSYDLATFRWVMRLLGKEDRLWSCFLAGYHSVREISDLDLELIKPFMAIRDIWFFGLNTGNSLAQGWLNDDYMDIHMEFLRELSEELEIGSEQPSSPNEIG